MTCLQNAIDPAAVMFKWIVMSRTLDSWNHWPDLRDFKKNEALAHDCNDRPKSPFKAKASFSWVTWGTEASVGLQYMHLPVSAGPCPGKCIALLVISDVILDE